MATTPPLTVTVPVKVGIEVRPAILNTAMWEAASPHAKAITALEMLVDAVEHNARRDDSPAVATALWLAHEALGHVAV